MRSRALPGFFIVPHTVPPHSNPIALHNHLQCEMTSLTDLWKAVGACPSQTTKQMSTRITTGGYEADITIRFRLVRTRRVLALSISGITRQPVGQTLGGPK